MKKLMLFFGLFLMQSFVFGQTGHTNGGSGSGSQGDYSTLYGYRAGYSSTSSSDYNSFFGSYAGNNNTTGTRNLFLGVSAGEYNTSGVYNIYAGFAAGGLRETSNENVFIGAYAGQKGEGDDNTIIGSYGSLGNTVCSGNRNTLMGSLAGTLNYGDENVLIGHKAGVINNGSYNTYVGARSAGVGTGFLSGASGDFNTCVGYLSGGKHIGDHNVILGDSTAYQYGGNRCVAIGGSAGFNFIGVDNIFIGYHAGYNNGDTYNWDLNRRSIMIGGSAGFNHTGIDNIFIGNHAGYNTDGSGNNIFLGNYSGYNNKGQRNAFVGNHTGYDNTTGYNNTFIGEKSGTNNTTGDSNTYLGYRAGHNCKTGTGNVFIGKDAGHSETGSNKLYIDNSSTSKPLIHGNFSTNALTINGTLRSTSDLSVEGDVQIGDDILLADVGPKTLGLDANFVPRMSNIRSLGNSGKRWRNIYYSNNLYQISDKRLKSNIQDMGYGMKEIMKFRPVTYTIKDDPEANTELGLLAQDVQPIIEEVVCTSEMVTDEKTGQQKSVPTEYLAVNYVELIPVLIKGMQEQQALIAAQQSRIEKLEALLSETKPTPSDSKDICIQDRPFDTPPTGSVFQNNPNPFNISTLIGYELPLGTKEAYLTISTINGKSLKNHKLDNTQKTGQITVSADGLSNGVYMYALIVDGNPVASGKMVVAK